MSENILLLHTERKNQTANQVLEWALKQQFREVIVVAYDEDGCPTVLNSQMTYEHINYVLDCAKYMILRESRDNT